MRPLFLLVTLGCGAKTASAIDPPAAPGALAPQLHTHAGAVLATWLEPIDGRHRLRFARWRGTWSVPATVVEDAKIVANWADTPSLAVGSDHAIVVTWAERSGTEPHAYDAVVARSTDNGATWRRLGTLHRDGTPTEHGFVSLAADPAGVRAIWLDGRAMSGGQGGTALRTAIVGASIGDESVVDDRVCDCCGTALANSATGAVVAYRDRSDDEIRDIAIAARGATGWAQKMLHDDRWKIAGCPVNGPAIAAHGARVAVAWFTGSDSTSRVRVAFSTDGGTTFAPPIEVDAAVGDRMPLGRVGIVLDDNGDAIVTWVASRREAAQVLASRISRDGVRGGETIVAATRATRDAGFPRIARHGDEVLIVWTEPGPSSKLRAKRLAIAALAKQPVREVTGSAAPRVAVVGAALPELAVSTVEGTATSLASLRGRPTLVNIWATWCEPCRHELPELVKLHERYRDRGLQMIALSIDREKPATDVTAFARRYGLTFPVWIDKDDRAASLLDARTLPVTLLVDATGTIRWRRDGTISADDAELARVLQALLDEASP